MPKKTDDIVDLLDLKKWDDFSSEQGGYQAKLRPEIARFAAEIQVISPLSDKNVKRLIEWAAPASAKLIEELFSLSNTVRVGSTKFSTYGMLHNAAETKERKEITIPWDINTPNVYERPESLSKEALIIGTSTEESGESVRTEFIHVILPAAKIQVLEKTDCRNIIREFDSVSEWLLDSVTRALNDTKNY